MKKIDLLKLAALIRYSDRYEISIQFWPTQTTVFINKDGVELASFGGDLPNFAVNTAIAYLDSITRKK
jgi:hypothetical protein